MPRHCSAPVVVVGIVASFLAVAAAGIAIGGYLFERFTRA